MTLEGPEEILSLYPRGCFRVLSANQISILEGHLLGDGHLAIGGKSVNPRLRINRCGEDSDYLAWTAAQFSEFVSEKGLSNTVVYDERYGKSYLRASLSTRRAAVFLPFYMQWYGGGKKVVPTSLILTPLSIAVWFADDGNIRKRKSKRNGYDGLEVSFSTYGFSKPEVEFLLEQLNARYANTFSIYGGYNGLQQYRIMGASRAARQLFAEIGPLLGFLPRKTRVWSENKSLFVPPLPLCERCGHDAIYLNGLYSGRGTRPLAQRYKCGNCQYGYKGPLLAAPVTPKGLKALEASLHS